MEQIRSRKNQYILHLRALAKTNDARRDAGEYVCDGEKLLREALPKIKNVPLLVYMSAYSDYHPSPFGVEPLCHLIKPTDRSQLDEVIATIERAARRDS